MPRAYHGTARKEQSNSLFNLKRECAKLFDIGLDCEDLIRSPRNCLATINIQNTRSDHSTWQLTSILKAAIVRSAQSI